MDNNLTIKSPRRRKTSLIARRSRAGYLFTLPFIIGIICIYLPILLDSILLSVYQGEAVTDYETNKTSMVYTFRAFEFYSEAFSEKGKGFVDVLLQAFGDLAMQVPTIVIFSLFIAVVLNQKMLGRAAFRAIFFVPVIIATGILDSLRASAGSVTDVVTSTADTGAGEGGIMQAEDLTEIFAGMGYGSTIVDFVVGLVNDIYNIINYSGVQMLIFLAALQGISPAIYEACTIDGATGWETFWKITLPMISPMILVNAAYTLIDSFTRPSNTVMLHLDKIADNGIASAMTWTYFGIAIVVIAVVAAVISSFVFYQRRD